MNRQPEPLTLGEKIGTVLLLAALFAAVILAPGCQPYPNAKPIGSSYKRAPMYWSYEANEWRTAPEVRSR